MLLCFLNDLKKEDDKHPPLATNNTPVHTLLILKKIAQEEGRRRARMTPTGYMIASVVVEEYVATNKNV